jgi:hypothetical protein
VIDVTKETPDSVATTAVNIFKAIGYIILGNLYDNVRMPKRMTFNLLVLLAFLTLMSAVVPAEIALDDNGGIEDELQWNQLVVQMSSIRMFESGVSLI